MAQAGSRRWRAGRRALMRILWSPCGMYPLLRAGCADMRTLCLSTVLYRMVRSSLEWRMGDVAERAQAVAVVLCAGQGKRMGAPQNKVFVALGGKPLLAHTLGAFEAARAGDEVALVRH